MKKPFFLVILAILLAGLVLFGPSDAAISLADTATNEVISSASNSSASATITITMTGILDE